MNGRRLQRGGTVVAHGLAGVRRALTESPVSTIIARGDSFATGTVYAIRVKMCAFESLLTGDGRSDLYRNVKLGWREGLNMIIRSPGSDFYSTSICA